MEAYHWEMGQLLEETEYQQHYANQFTNECIEYTFNAMKFAQRVAKKDVIGGLSYPLNYVLH